jgi:hypothetical protein
MSSAIAPHAAACASVRLPGQPGAGAPGRHRSPNPGTVFGTSLYRELQLLGRCRITRAQPLNAAAAAAARVLNLADRGHTAPGQRAAIMLVSCDPYAWAGSWRATRIEVTMWQWLNRRLPRDLRCRRHREGVAVALVGHRRDVCRNLDLQSFASVLSNAFNRDRRDNERAFGMPARPGLAVLDAGGQAACTAATSDVGSKVRRVSGRGLVTWAAERAGHGAVPVRRPGRW